MTAAAFLNIGKDRIDAGLLAQIGTEVEFVDAELSRQMESPVGLVEKVGKHTLKAGGKRLRPAFVALSAKATGLNFDAERSRRLGACMEMIHMATLIHDDVIDNSAVRRGRETASAAYGNTASILAGDTLLAKAMVILAVDGDLEIIRNVSESVVEMAEGEVRELATREDFDLTEDEHLEVLRMKTAAFIQSCCEVGALVAGASMMTRAALRSYGYHVGMAFQIVDDLLDYRGERTKTGKPQATDFREGCATLPLIFLRPLLSEEEREVARRKFGNGVTDDEIRMISGWMETRGAFDRASALASDHVTRAIDALAELPESASRALLETVAHFVLARQS